jgi:hypothetical protein
MDLSDIQRKTPAGSVVGVSASYPGSLCDISCEDTVGGYDENLDEYMDRLGFAFVEESPAQAIAEASLGEIPLLQEVPLLADATVDGPVVLDFTASINQRWTLTGDLAAGNITFTLPPGPRKVTLEIIQDVVGGRAIPATAWPAGVDWGSKGAPAFDGLTASQSRFLVLDFRGGTTVFGHYDTNIFGGV